MGHLDEFDLSALVKSTAMAHPDVASPAVIAELLFSDIPIEQHALIVSKLLPRYVGDTLRRAALLRQLADILETV